MIELYDEEYYTDWWLDSMNFTVEDDLVLFWYTNCTEPLIN